VATVSPQPADGTAIILHLIEAAREWAAEPMNAGMTPVAYTLAAWVDALEKRYAREKHDLAPVGWEPRRWRELVAGDRIEIGGHEAVIEKAYDGTWHVDPENYVYHPGPDRGEECRPCGGRCRETRGRKYPALEQSYVSVKLEGREPVYTMPPDGEVETLRGPAGQAIDEANGHRSALGEHEIDVMASWAADAALTLEHAGLGPVEVLR
jgi:hypothetical protein